MQEWGRDQLLLFFICGISIFIVLSVLCCPHVVPAAGSSQWWVHTCHVLVHVAPCLAAVGALSTQL